MSGLSARYYEVIRERERKRDERANWVDIVRREAAQHMQDCIAGSPEWSAFADLVMAASHAYDAVPIHYEAYQQQEETER